jgi:hypothetical protein
MWMGVVLSMNVSRAASPQRDGTAVAVLPHRESFAAADRASGSGAKGRDAGSAGSRRAVSVAQRNLGQVASSNTSRVRSLLDAQARRRLAPRPSGGPAPQAQRLAPTLATAALAPTSATPRTAATAPTLLSPPATGGTISVQDPTAHGRAVASTPAVSRIAVRPAPTVIASARNSRVGGPYTGGHTTVGGPAIGRMKNGGTIGTPLRHGF